MFFFTDEPRRGKEDEDRLYLFPVATPKYIKLAKEYTYAEFMNQEIMNNRMALGEVRVTTYFTDRGGIASEVVYSKEDLTNLVIQESYRELEGVTISTIDGKEIWHLDTRMSKEEYGDGPEALVDNYLKEHMSEALRQFNKHKRKRDLERNI